MQMRTKAAALYLLPTLAVVGVWYMLLFAGSAPGVELHRTLSFILADGPRPWWFRWLFALPFLCLGLSAAYFSRIPTSLAGAVLLLVLGGVLAVATWLTVTPEVALFTTLPLLYGALVVGEHWPRREHDDT